MAREQTDSSLMRLRGRFNALKAALTGAENEFDRLADVIVA